MFINQSMTGIGIVIMLASYFLKWTGVEFAEGDVEKVIETLGQLIGWILTIWGNLRRKDLLYGLIRKQS